MKYTFDKERTLFLNSEAVENIEEHYDLNIDKILGEHMRSKDLQFMLWQALRHEDKTLTLEDARTLFSKLNYTELVAIFTDLITIKN